MKRLFRKIPQIAGKELPWQFRKAEFTETTEELHNPARGWYQIYNFSAGECPDLENLEWGLDGRDNLALVVINIGEYRDRDIDEIGMNNMKTILNVFVNAGYDIILRVVYDHEGKAPEKEPFSFAQVENHLRQLEELFQEVPDGIFIYQGMLVGNWGEMHTSRHLKDDRMDRLAEILRSVKSPDMYLAVRRPVQWRHLHSEESVSRGPKGVRLPNTMHKPCDLMGLFDDGMLGSESHLGTFGEADRNEGNWLDAWNRKEELDFEQMLCAHVPNGGEVVYGEDYSPSLKWEKAEQVLRKMHITYLNKVHDDRMLKLFKEWVYTGSSIWNRRSFYDYVGAHLGYRFIVRDVNVVFLPGEEISCQLEITIENAGFANFYQENLVSLAYEDDKGYRIEQSLDCDLRELQCGRTERIVCRIVPCDGQIVLLARRKWDGARIRFANHSDVDEGVVLGSFVFREVKK